MMGEGDYWPHGPPHFVRDRGVYMVTGSTVGKALLFGSRKRLRFLQDKLLESCAFYGWTVQAWACLGNHYHFVGLSPEVGAGSLAKFLGRLHGRTSRFVNGLDGVTGRKVWHNYWESRITHDSSHYARLKYVTENAVHHGLVADALDYPWCSARWLKRVCSGSFWETMNSFRTDTLKVRDDF